MTITSLTLAFVQYGSAADMARTRGVAASAPAAEVAPAPVPASNAGSCEHRSTCGSPRQSPLYMALMDALGSLARSAPPPASQPSAETAAPVAPTAASTDAAAAAGAAGTANTPSPTTAASAPDAAAATTPAVVTGTDAAAVAPADMEEAVMNFARALMQALRDTAQGDGGEDREGRRAHGHGHHHHEHHEHQDYGRRAWGDPAQRIEQLGAQIGAPAPADAPITVLDSGATPTATPATTAAAAATAAADGAAAAATPAGAPTAMIYIQLNMSDAAPKASPFSRATQGLVQAFSTLQHALGLPATDSQDSLEAQLGAFLQTLAEKLRGGEGNALASTQPGALLNVSA